MLRGTVVLAFVLLFAAGCRESDSADGRDPVLTEDASVASDAGLSAIQFVAAGFSAEIRVTPDNGEASGHRTILETLGSGVAFADFDGDTWPDLLFGLGGNLSADRQVLGSGLRYFRNQFGTGFREQSHSAAVETPRLYSHGQFAADFDQDGFLDVLVTGYGRLLLFRNLGDGTFQECASDAGLDAALWSTGAAWGDLNGDGADDLYVVNYVNWSFENHPACEGFAGQPDVCSPANFDPQPDFVFMSDGGGGFRCVNEIAVPADSGKGLAALAGDMDLDGDVDVYVANDTTPNFLFVNDGNGQLREQGISSGTAFGTRATADGSMGLELADLTLNGRPDLWVTNYEHQNFALYRNDAPGVFQHVSDRVGVSAIGTVFVGFGTVAEDFDLDGDADLVVANGHVMLASRNSPLRQRPLLFRNDAGQRFVNVAESSGEYFRGDHRGRGVATGDFDGDGRMDLVITHCNEPAAFLRNTSTNTGRLLTVRPVSTQGARQPVGVAARLTCQGQQQLSLLKSGASFLSSSESLLRFAVPDEDAIDATLQIDWHGGRRSSHRIRQAGHYVIVEGREPVLTVR